MQGWPAGLPCGLPQPPAALLPGAAWLGRAAPRPLGCACGAAHALPQLRTSHCASSTSSSSWPARRWNGQRPAATARQSSWSASAAAAGSSVGASWPARSEGFLGPSDVRGVHVTACHGKPARHATARLNTDQQSLDPNQVLLCRDLNGKEHVRGACSSRTGASVFMRLGACAASRPC